MNYDKTTLMFCHMNCLPAAVRSFGCAPFVPLAQDDVLSGSQYELFDPQPQSTHLPQSQWSQLPTGELALFRLTSPLMRFPPLAVIRGSPWSASHCSFRLTRSGRFLLRRIAHWATASFAPQPCENNCRCRDEILRKAQDDIRDTDNSVENSAWMALLFGIDGVCVEAV